MIASIDKLCTWAEKQVKQRTGPPRPYRGRYPDLSGPTYAEMETVRRIADAIERKEP